MDACMGHGQDRDCTPVLCCIEVVLLVLNFFVKINFQVLNEKVQTIIRCNEVGERRIHDESTRMHLKSVVGGDNFVKHKKSF